MKKVWTLALAGILCTCILVGCAPDGKKVLEDAFASSQAPVTAQTQFTLDANIGLDGLDVGIQGAIQSASSEGIQMLHLSGNSLMFKGLVGSDALDETCYLVQREGQSYLYLNSPNLGGWFYALLEGDQAALPAVFTASAADTSLYQGLYALAHSVKNRGEEDHNGVNCYRIEMEFDFSEQLESSAFMGDSSSYSEEDRQAIERFMDALSHLKLNFYVGTEDSRLYTVNLDASQTCKELLEIGTSYTESESQVVPEFRQINLTLDSTYNYDAQSALTLPEEAQNAKLVHADSLIQSSVLWSLFGGDAASAPESTPTPTDGSAPSATTSPDATAAPAS